eukprot:517692-Rhodomonas_salina.2
MQQRLCARDAAPQQSRTRSRQLPLNLPLYLSLLLLLLFLLLLLQLHPRHVQHALSVPPQRADADTIPAVDGDAPLGRLVRVLLLPHLPRVQQLLFLHRDLGLRHGSCARCAPTSVQDVHGVYWSVGWCSMKVALPTSWREAKRSGKRSGTRGKV